jgi:hypothetical protein
VPGRQAPVFEEADLLETLGATPFMKSSLRRLLGRAAAARRRLVLQYKDAFLAELAARMADAPAAAFSAAAAVLAERLPELYAAQPGLFISGQAGLLQSPDLLRQLFWELVLQRIAKGEPAGWAVVLPVLLNGLAPAAVAREMTVLPATPAPVDWLRQWEMAAVAAAVRLDAKRGEAPPAAARKPQQAADEEGKEPEPRPPIAGREAEQQEADATQAAPAVVPPAGQGTDNRPDVRPANPEGMEAAGDVETPPGSDTTPLPRTVMDAADEEEVPLPVDLGDALNVVADTQPRYPEEKTPAGALHYLSDAGLVLLHPFFPTLFKELGFTEGKAFKNFEAQVRAVHLLHFIVCGEEQPPEYRLLLPKLLCGLPLNAPIAQVVELDEKERAEAIALMEAAIRHWGALGNASPDGLREGFLQREGKLEKRADGWRLIVERKTIDVLLDRLPWGIGMVVLPWMGGEVVRVEWR